MELVGESFVIPLFNATLISTDKFDLGDGISIIGIPDTFEEKLRSSPELIARYESSLEYMKVGLELVPSNFKENDALSIPDGHPKSPTCGHLKIPHPPGPISQ